MDMKGIWYNGVSSRGEVVAMQMRRVGFLHLENAGEMVELDISKLSISTRLGSTARSIQIPGQGYIQCDDSELLDAWFPNTSRIEKWVDWIERRRSAVISSAVITIVTVVMLYMYGIPYAALKVAPHVSPKIERMMSEQVLKILDITNANVSSLPVKRQAEFQTEFKAMIKGMPRESEMELFFRSSPALGANAFALPDGTIVVTDELVELADNNEQIMTVIAHEIGHHEHRHGVRQTLESAGILAIAAALFGDVSGSSLTVSLPVVLQNGYSRGHEQEADEFAFKTLIRQGRSPQAFADLFKKLNKETMIHDDNVMNYVSTHPASQDRIDRAERAAKGAKNKYQPE
jgi:Zn-dependent protease with chaperone function